ncbi:MAG: type 1 glutamine amidotransferase domain-containing protein [Rhizobiaceae bacterium]
MTVLIATSTNEYDPTEVAVPWKILKEAGYKVVFATDTGKPGTADQRMLNGNKFGILKRLLIADKSGQQAYCEMLQDHAFQNPMHYRDIKAGGLEGLVLPGGHAKGIIPYLESQILQKAIAEFFLKDKPVAAICHGVVAACRARNLKTGKSVLYKRKTTALLKRQEMLAYQVTRWNLGDYYRTYPKTVEDEVVENLHSASDFIHGPLPLLRDDMKHLSRGFTVRDGNYLSARWPGDAHRFACDFIKILKEA